MRLQGVAIWEILTFLLNAVLFLLVGLQLPGVHRPTCRDTRRGELVGWALLVSAGRDRRAARVDVHGPVRGARMADRARGPSAAARARARSGWRSAGRACAARCRSPPRSRSRSTIDAGGPFPDRELIIFLTFAVILVTLVGPGADARAADHRLGLDDDGSRSTRSASPGSAWPRPGSSRIDELGEPDWIGTRQRRARARNLLDYRRRRFGALVGRRRRRLRGRAPTPGGGSCTTCTTRSATQLVDLRNRGEISDEVRRKIERDLDLEESRLEN